MGRYQTGKYICSNISVTPRDTDPLISFRVQWCQMQSHSAGCPNTSLRLGLGATHHLHFPDARSLRTWTYSRPPLLVDS